jgi:hypothetical protein
LKQLKLAESFLDDKQELSLFDVVLPLLKMGDRGVPELLLGSCFAIGVGVYATAAHIFEPFMQARHRYKPFDPRKEPPTIGEKLDRQSDMTANKLFEGVDVNCGAIVLDQAAIRAGQYKLIGFSLVRHVVIFLDDDLAILFLHDDKRRNVNADRHPIAILPIIENPKVGDEITVAGFPGKNNQINFGVVDGKIEGAAWIGLVASDGVITHKHEVMRDVGHCFYPCIETTASMLPGHSGGPAISKETWGVSGVNSASIGGHGYSVISWAGKALDWDFELPFDIILGKHSIPSGDPISLRRMAECEVIRII